MGCDIHMFAEYRDPKRPDHWWSFSDDELEGPRDYALFGALAGVRSSDLGIAPDRGVPQDASWSVADHYTYFVYPKPSPGSRSVTPEEAARYRPFNDSRVICPDWHSASWATPDEYERALSDSGRLWKPADIYFAHLAAAREMERRGYEVRFVFWFDN